MLAGRKLPILEPPVDLPHGLPDLFGDSFNSPEQIVGNFRFHNIHLGEMSKSLYIHLRVPAT